MRKEGGEKKAQRWEEEKKVCIFSRSLSRGMAFSKRTRCP